MWPLGQAFHPIYKLHVCTDITAFVNDVIGKPVNVAATNLSTAPVIMANALSKDLFNKIILINPVSLQQLKCIPDKSTKFKQNIINLPIIGTFIYNKLMSPIKVDLLFRNKFISRGQLISDNMKDAYYESDIKGKAAANIFTQAFYQTTSILILRPLSRTWTRMYQL